MTDNVNQSMLDAITTTVQPSFIVTAPEPPTAPAAPATDYNAVCEQLWAEKSNALIASYKYGVGIAKFGDNDANIVNFFKRLSYAMCTIITNEHMKRGESAEYLKPTYNILDSIFLILSKEIQKKALKDFDISYIISALNGFIINYNKQKEKG